MNFKNTRVYERSLELVRLSQSAIAGLSSGCGFLGDQLRRSSASIVLNLAEGSGKCTSADRRRYLLIARGSAYETSAAFDLARELGAITRDQHAHAIDVCDHVAAMLTRLAS